MTDLVHNPLATLAAKPSIVAVRSSIHRIEEKDWQDRSEADREHLKDLERKLWNLTLDALGKKGILIYSSNNSGGSWWLSDKNWDDLAAAGWAVHWILEPEPGKPSWDSGGTSSYDRDPIKLLTPYQSDGSDWIGARARSCAIACDDPNEAIAAWESITGECASDLGCTCCGRPHDFTFRDRDGEEHYGDYAIRTSFTF